MELDGKHEYPFCPMCGRETKYRANPEWLLGYWSGKYGKLLSMLIVARRAKRGVSMKEMLKVYYGKTNLEDMPEHADHVVRAVFANNAEKLKNLGWTIVGPHVTGNGFWLVPVEVSD